jgi:hypothetical protein
MLLLEHVMRIIVLDVDVEIGDVGTKLCLGPFCYLLGLGDCKRVQWVTRVMQVQHSVSSRLSD